MKFSELKFLWYRWRISNQAKANAYHYLTGRGEQAVIALLGPAPALPGDFATEVHSADVTKERAELQEVGRKLAPHWWWPLALLFIPGLAFISWRADTRLFTLTGWPPADAMLLGLMLTVLAVLLAWALMRAWHLPYDGTSRRTRRLALTISAYVVLVGSILAIRLGQADPNEPWYVRLGSSGLILAATIGPSFALELLLRKLFEIAPLLHRRMYLRRTINDATGAVVRVAHQREVLARRTEEWHHLATRLQSVYDVDYERYTLHQTVSSE
jgi:hypothetical protein